MSEQKKVNIKGMHCRSCELVVEKNLKNVPGVIGALVDHKKGIAHVQYEGNAPEHSAIEAAIRASGYEMTNAPQHKKQLISFDVDEWTEFVAALVVVLVIYLGLNAVGLFDMQLGVGATPGLLSILLIGLVAGVSTCMAMVGGLVLSISARHAELHPEATAMQKFRPHVFFNAGRLVSFAMLGGVIGLLGAAFKLSASVLGVFTLLVGFVMLVIGLKLTELFPRLTASTFTLPAGIARKLGIQNDSEYSHWGSFVTGALTFFLPCGFTQAAQLLAISSGSFWSGALIMFFFALGTLPGFVGIGGITAVVKGEFARYFFKGTSVIVIALAAINIFGGATLLGIPLPSISKSEAARVEIVDGVQIVRMEQTAQGYKPDHIVIKRGVPVKWVITSTNQFTCASQLAVPSLGISKSLNSGDNVIEFTPENTGDIPFSCNMGMFRGTVTVID